MVMPHERQKLIEDLTEMEKQTKNPQSISLFILGAYMAKLNILADKYTDLIESDEEVGLLVETLLDRIQPTLDAKEASFDRQMSKTMGIDSLKTVGDLLVLLSSYPDDTPLYFGSASAAPKGLYVGIVWD